MGEYEPDDSRNITLTQDTAPGEPPRTGPREGETRQPREDKASGKPAVRQHNNAQEVTGGDLPDPERAKGFDQDEG